MLKVDGCSAFQCHNITVFPRSRVLILRRYFIFGSLPASGSFSLSTFYPLLGRFHDGRSIPRRQHFISRESPHASIHSAFLILFNASLSTMHYWL